MERWDVENVVHSTYVVLLHAHCPKLKTTTYVSSQVQLLKQSHTTTMNIFLQQVITQIQMMEQARQ